jgi:glutamine cyclotransferase
MKTRFFLLFTPLLFLLTQCSSETDYSDLKLRVTDAKKLKSGGQLNWSVSNPEKRTYSVLSLELAQQPLVAEEGEVHLPEYPLGDQELKVVLQIDQDTIIRRKTVRILAKNPPKLYTYTLLNEFRHDPSFYTQGLEFYGDTLLESTGKRGASVLRKIDFETGEVYAQTALENNYFGEGITVWNKQVIWLTWEAGLGFVYDLEGLVREKSFVYGQSQQGWGLCHDDQYLYKSDGTNHLWKLDPNSLEEKGSIQMVTHKSLYNKANELEYVDGMIYANVYQKQSIMIIDAKSGALTGVVNMGGLIDRIKKGEEWDPLNSVLNGIAYHPGRDSFFVTGKNWNKLFEIRFEEK